MTQNKWRFGLCIQMKVWPSQNNLLGPKIPRVVSFHWCIGLGSWKQSQLFNLEKTNQQHHVVIVLQHTWLALGKVGRHEGGNWRADAYAFAFLVLQTHTHTHTKSNKHHPASTFHLNIFEQRLLWEDWRFLWSISTQTLIPCSMTLMLTTVRTRR